MLKIVLHVLIVATVAVLIWAIFASVVSSVQVPDLREILVVSGVVVCMGRIARLEQRRW